MVPPLAWVSDITSIIHAGLEPIFVDIDRRTLGIDQALVLRALEKYNDIAAVLGVHILGYNCLSDALLRTLADRDIPLIEDVCESHGATHNGEKCGTFGWAANFSLYYAHHMTTVEGGIISTDDSDLYQTLRMLRSHGMTREATDPNLQKRFREEHPDLSPDFTFAHLGFNVRSTEINAVLGRNQLKRLDHNNGLRCRNLGLFLDALNPNIFATDFAREGSCNYAFTLMLNDADTALRDRVEQTLRELGVEFRRGMSGGGNQLRQPYIRRIPGVPSPKEFPNAEHVHHFGWYIGTTRVSTQRILRGWRKF